MEIRGYALHKGEPVAVFTGDDCYFSYFQSEESLAKALEGGLSDIARTAYVEALTGLQYVKGRENGIESLQEIEDVNDFMLPDGTRLGDTEAGNQLEDFAYKDDGPKVRVDFVFPPNTPGLN